jgi:hypothetical protein
VAALMTRIERRSLLETGRGAPTGPGFEWVIDGAFATLAAWRSTAPQGPAMPFAYTWFAPIAFMLLLHVLPRVMPQGRATWWLRDRFVAGLGFALASALLPFDLCLRAAALALLVWALVVIPSPNSDLTNHD